MTQTMICAVWQHHIWRKQALQLGVCTANARLENHTKQRKISPQTRWCEIMLKERILFVKANITCERALQRIQSTHVCFACVENSTARSFEIGHTCAFELTNEIGNSVTPTCANDRLYLWLALLHDPINFILHGQFTIDVATEIFETWADTEHGMNDDKFFFRCIEQNASFGTPLVHGLLTHSSKSEMMTLFLLICRFGRNISKMRDAHWCS